MRTPRKTRKIGRRITVAFLCLCMVLSMTLGRGGIVAAVSEDERGAADETACTHVHDETCGYSAPAEGSPCDHGCTDTDGDGEIDHDPACAYVPATDGSPCTHVHDETCGGLPAVQEDAPVDHDGEIMPLALTDVRVTVEQNAGTGSQEIGESTDLTWEHNQLWKLNIGANFSGVSGGQVKITVAPGLKIDSYFNGESSNFEKVETSSTHDGDLPGYTFPQSYDTVTYTVSSTAALVSIDLTLAVDTVLWPKVDGWKITDAIKVEITGTDVSEIRTANVTVNYASNETSASWNQLYSADSNDSVPAQANKDFRMKNLVVATNLHNSPLGMYYPQLTVTVPLPKLKEEAVYAEYAKVETAPATSPRVSQSAENHTVTFTWENLYVPAGSNFTVTPYFKWTNAQTAGKKVVFSDSAKLTAAATAYSPASVSGTQIDLPSGNIGASEFTVREDIHVTVTGTNRGSIYNYGSTTQVYQLGQFQVRNDGFGDTGNLTLKFSYDSGTAHVTAQRIPLKVGGTVSNITYKDSSGAEQTATIEEKYYIRTGSFPCYLLVAPEGEYFTEVTATIDGLSPQYVGYNNSAALSPSNGCVTFGTMVDRNSNGSFRATLTITGDGITGSSVSDSYTTNITNQSSGKQSTQMKIDPASPLFTFQGSSANKVQLGTDVEARTVTFRGYISATEYPYTNNQVVDRPVIYIRLPNAIKVNKDDVKLSSARTDFTGAVTGETLIESTKYQFTELPANGGLGYHVYKIEFNDDNSYSGAIGWFNEQLGQTRLKLEFDMVADVDVADVTLEMYNTVFVGFADDSKINASGSLSANQRQDAFDVDGDGIVEEYFSTMADNDAYKLELDAPRIGLNFNSTAKLTNEGDENYKNYKVPENNVEGLSANGHIMYLTHEDLQNNVGIDFRFTAKNETGSALSIDSADLGKEDFYYYIPVPKKGDKWDSHIQDAAFGLNMVLAEEVQFTESGGPGLVEALYSTTVDATDTDPDGTHHYNNADEVDGNYKPWDQVQDQIDQIKMIRISVKQGLTPEQKSAGFPVGYEAVFNIRFKFANTEELVGQYIEFGPCGITTYKRNNTDASGHTPTQRIRAEIQTGIIAGRIFIDANFNGVYDEGEKIEYEGSGITISAQHKVGADPGLDPDSETHLAAASSGGSYDNSYELTGLQARTYTVTAVNSTYSDGAPKVGSLRFIPLAVSDSRPASTYLDGYLGSTSFDVKVDGTSQNQMMDIGLQKPHTVTFQVEYEDLYSTSASARPTPPSAVTVYVWHDTTLNGSGVTVPTFTLDSDFQWEHGENPEWTAGVVTLDASATHITEDVIYTAKAVRKQHAVSYDMNLPGGYIAAQDAPTGTEAVNGQSVSLKCVGEDHTPKPAVTGDSAVVFMGWTAEQDTTVYGKETQKETLTPRLLDSVTMRDTDVTVHALWGYDTNGNGTADALEDRYTVTYDAGEGRNAPGPVTNCIYNETITLDNGADMAPPEGEGILFVGWKETNPGKIYSKDDIANEGSIDKDLHKPGGEYTVTGSVDLYAVWAYDENNNDVPDYQETMFKLSYNDNGVSTHPDDYPVDSDYLPKTVVTLWKPGSAWTGELGGQQVVFVGWSEEQKDTPLSEKAGVTDVITEVTMPESGDKNVYAVWAYDRNRNSKPDYDDTWYQLIYNRNGGEGEPTKEPDSVAILPGGSSVVLPKDEIKWKRTVDAKTGIFVGWSLTQADVIFDQDGKATVGETEVNLTDNKFLLTSPYAIGTEVDGDVTLYAVYAEDDNNNNVPDYMENAWQVYYYANGGTAAAPGVTVEADGLFRKCGHHHVAGERDVALIELETGKLLIEKKDAVLLGWSLTQPLSDVDSEEAKTAARIITTVDIPSGAVGGEQCVRVYAVWAVDLNHNHVPDYEDAHWKQLYFRNQALTYWRPVESGDDETNAAAVDTTLPDGVKRVEFKNSTLPEEKTNILTGMTVDVPGNTLVERWDYDDDDHVIHHYVQLGWSGFCHPAATSAENAAAWIHRDEDAAAEGVQRRVSGAIYQYNFAVWAFDDNYNGKADYLDNHYNLRFDLKGGTGGPGDKRGVLEGIKVELSPAPTKERAVFLGWSATDLCAGGDLTAEPVEKLLGTDEEWNMPGAPTTLYAVWAADRDNNGVADYAQQVTIRYDGNPQRGGTTENVPEEQKVLYSSNQVALSSEVPTHSPVEGQAVVFLAWSENQTERIYSRSEGGLLRRDVPLEKRHAPGEMFTLPGKTEEVTLYAVWGYDINGKNGADVLERRYTLTYDANGGSFAPDPVRGRLEGERLTRLSMDARYGRENVILVGWTEEKNRQSEILTWENAHSRASDIDSQILVAYTMGASDATIYAVWAEDQNGNGIPDYRENKNKLTYQYSGADTPTGLRQGEEYLPGTEVTLWADENAGTAEAWSRGAGSARSVFVGWTLSQEVAAEVRTEAPGSDDLIIEVVMTENVDVYALWAQDRNANGLPDYSEKKITLTLDPNGGMEGT